jgi:aspartyl-tRNA(Asn)/glutamyl-tRNA(Gln) amidotransferase subunit A
MRTSMTFAFQTIAELSAGLEARAFTPVDILDDIARRLDVLEPVLNSFACLDLEGARRDAEAAAARQSAGARLSILDGIPTSVKDLIAQKGLPQRFGSRTTPDTPVDEDAPSVARLRAAGAVLLGKSTTSEFGCKGVGDSPLTGITRNPWNTDLTPGGSSAGAAAMVAAGLVPYALGTDGGGSIRIPSALSGLFGIKAQFARVPVYPTSATPTLAHVGPLARTVTDAAEVLRVISGFDRRDPFSVAVPVPDWPATAPRRPLRIAYAPTLGYAAPMPEVADLVAAAASAIADLGHHVTEVPHVMDDPAALMMSEFYAGAGTRLRATIDAAPDLIDPAVLKMLRPALSQKMEGYYQKVFERYALRDRMRLFFEDYDLLISPTLPCAAFGVGLNAPPDWHEQSPVGWVTYTYPFNLTGQPAASVPAGFTAQGLPVGLQIVGPSHGETDILALSAQYQSAHSTLHIRPPTAA